MALLMSGNVNDLGYNYMSNEGRIQVEKLLKLNSTWVYSDLEKGGEPATNLAIQDSLDRKATLIVVSSQVNVNTALKWAKSTQTTHPNVYWMIRGRAANAKEYPNVGFFGFNSAVLQYILGYFAGLETKTGAVGFVAPGLPIQKLFTANAFFIGAKKSNPNIKFFHIYTGQWLDPTLAKGAAEELLKVGCDLIGMSQDDMSVQEVVMKNSSYGLGATGYRERLIYGESIAVSYLTYWTDMLRHFAEKVQNGTNGPEHYNGEIANGALALDEFSFRVEPEVKRKTEEEFERAKNPNFNQYRCDPGFKVPFFAGNVDENGCIKNDIIFYSSEVMLPGMTPLGQYVVPTTFVPFSKSIIYGFSITSGFCILVSLVTICLVLYYRNAKVIRSSSPSFCVAILFGAITIFTAIILWAQNPTNGICRARIWMASLGYSFMLGNLIIKNWRIWLLFDNPKLKRRKITNWKLFPFVAGIILLDALILALWVGLGDIVAEQRTGIDGLGEFEYHNVCSSNKAGNVVLYILLIFHAIMLLVGCFISFKIKAVDIEEFNESKPISTTLYSISFCLFIIIPLMVSPQSVANQTIIICACGLFTTFSTLLILFGSKFLTIAKEGPAFNETFRTPSKNKDMFNTVDVELGATRDPGITGVLEISEAEQATSGSGVVSPSATTSQA
eukprot:gene455-575_t